MLRCVPRNKKTYIKTECICRVGNAHLRLYASVFMLRCVRQNMSTYMNINGVTVKQAIPNRLAGDVNRGAVFLLQGLQQTGPIDPVADLA